MIFRAMQISINKPIKI